jgi:hypothetical protein
MPKRSSILIWTGAAVIVLSICKAPARDLGYNARRALPTSKQRHFFKKDTG